MLSIAVDSASIILNVTPIASTMTIKAEFIGGPTVLRCFIIISVFKYLHANFPILLEMTEFKVGKFRFKKSSLRAFSTEKSKSCFRTVG